MSSPQDHKSLKGPESPQSPKSPGDKTASPPAMPASPAMVPLNDEEPSEAVYIKEEDTNGASTIDSYASTTASLSSTIFEYRTVQERTYHREFGDAESWEPNDQLHFESMEITHHAFLRTLEGKLFLSPLEKNKIHKVLDVGTGTGLWPIDFADEFLNAQVIGTDITPIQPSWVPANVQFELDDCNRGWTWTESSFDFIHLRMLIGVVEDWVTLFRNAFRCAKPGAYVKSMVTSAHFYSDDGSVKKDSALAQWQRIFAEGSKKLGRSFVVVEDDVQRKAMEEAGFVDITVKKIKIPFGTWPEDKRLSELGLWWKMAFESDLEGYLNYIFHAVLGWTLEQTSAFATHVRKEWADPKIHSYLWMHVVYGRKPEETKAP